MDKMFWIICTVFVLLPGAFSSEEQRNLIKYLFEEKDYMKNVRPVLYENTTIMVNISIDLDQINDVDEKFQTFKTMIWLTQRWTDEYLVWDPADFNGLETIRIPAEMVWLPDTVLYNTKNEGSNDPIMTVSTLVIVTNDGYVDWSAPLNMISSCEIKVYLYPFDRQNCHLKFGSWQHDSRYIDYAFSLKEAEIQNPNGEWDLIKLVAVRNKGKYPCCPDRLYPDITFNITIDRKPLFYVVNLIVPCLVISAMAVVEFILPCNSGEKVSLGITVLLSMTVFMLVIAENMPATSSSIPILGRFYVITIFLVSFSTVMTVLVLNLHHRAYKMPKWIRHVFLEVMSGVLCMREQIQSPSVPTFFKGGTQQFELLPQMSIDHISSNDMKDEKILTTTDFMDVGENGIFHDTLNRDGLKKHSGPGRLNRMVLEVLGYVKFISHRFQEKDHEEQMKMEWQMVAKVVDRFFLIIYLICVLLMDLIMFLQIQNMDGEESKNDPN